MTRPADIVFDHAAALTAVAAIDRARSVLGESATARVGASATARTHFRGAHADDFAIADRAIGQTSNDARRGLGALRSAILAASEAATVAQVARTAEQHVWDAAQLPPLRPGPS
jgi:hypothetical protein